MRYVGLIPNSSIVRLDHPFTFTPSVSLFLACDSDEDDDRLTAALAGGGDVLMPPGGYGSDSRFARVNGRVRRLLAAELCLDSGRGRRSVRSPVSCR